jgi:hypothetical protein
MVKGEGKYRVNKVTGEFERKREGKENKEKIFQFIYGNRDHGVKANDIIMNTGLSKEAVHNHLTALLSEGRIYKNERRKYFPEISILNEFLAFSKLMREKAFWLIDKEIMHSDPESDLPYDLGKYPRLKLYQKLEMNIPDNKKLTFQDIEKSFPKASMYLIRMLLGPITSEEYCTPHFRDKESLEKSLFELSNRIGAYITYIFLQAMYPLADPKLDCKDRSELTRTLIDKSITLEDLFEMFRYLITQLGLTGCNLKLNEHKKLFELSNNNFKTLSNALQKVYPNLYIGFENWWMHATCNTLALYNLRTASSTCKHEWKEKYLFKYRSCHVCRKCHNISSKPVKMKNK